MDNQGIPASLERIADALEKLGEDPVIQIETAPPVFPHCERMNPTVAVDESGGVGALAEFVIRCECDHCKNVFYVLPIQWRCVKSLSELEQTIEEQKELTGHGNNGSQ
jgi:hypothetical protein